MNVCLLWVLCVVRWRSLRRADQSSRGVLPAEVRLCVWSRNIKNEEVMTLAGSQLHLHSIASSNVIYPLTWRWPKTAAETCRQLEIKQKKTVVLWLTYNTYSVSIRGNEHTKGMARPKKLHFVIDLKFDEGDYWLDVTALYFYGQFRTSSRNWSTSLLPVLVTAS